MRISRGLGMTLGIRVGMHSGAVMAGVLMGDRWCARGGLNGPAVPLPTSFSFPKP